MSLNQASIPCNTFDIFVLENIDRSADEFYRYLLTLHTYVSASINLHFWSDFPSLLSLYASPNCLTLHFTNLPGRPRLKRSTLIFCSAYFRSPAWFFFIAWDGENDFYVGITSGFIGLGVCIYVKCRNLVGVYFYSYFSRNKYWQMQHVENLFSLRKN